RSRENQSGEEGFPQKSISRGFFHARINLARKDSHKSQSDERPASGVPEKINLARKDSHKSQSDEAFSYESQSGEARQVRKPRNFPRQTHFARNLGSPNGLL
ncbi:MAG: hypothetical protein J6S63_05655, partial [Atopobiaceae bacterium]|nr:hypothetical protein [Atopobiaceae bacterium]